MDIGGNEIENYIEANSKEFEEYLTVKTKEFLKKKWWAAFFCTALCSLNIVNLDVSVMASAISPIIAATIISAWERFTRWGFPALALFDMFCSSVVIYSFSVVCFYYANNIPTYNAPIIQGCMVATLLSFRKSTVENSVRNFLIGLIPPILGLVFLDRLDQMITWQAITGSLIGGMSGIFLNSKYRFEFYVVNENTNARRHLIQQLTNMMHDHQIKLLNSFYLIEETMPIGESECIAIVLDVQGSSRYKDADFKTRLDRTLGLCYKKMMEGYVHTGSAIHARAFRVKENYDGFICTVGFPFACAADSSKEDSAVLLGLDFIKVFNQEFAGFREIIHCGIGLARGVAEGYFPSVGPKLYDMRGDALVLAKRYESFRSVVFAEYETRRGHILILNSSCYDGLRQSTKDRFAEIKLNQHKHAIRDDPTAEVVYYTILQDGAA